MTIDPFGENLGELLSNTLAMVLQFSSSWQPGFSFRQWFLGLRTGSGPETGQGIIPLLGWLCLAFR